MSSVLCSLYNARGASTVCKCSALRIFEASRYESIINSRMESVHQLLSPLTVNITPQMLLPVLTLQCVHAAIHFRLTSSRCQAGRLIHTCAGLRIVQLKVLAAVQAAELQRANGTTAYQLELHDEADIDV
jgi:hypothetical protein